jgi:hypothetical protein
MSSHAPEAIAELAKKIEPHGVQLYCEALKTLGVLEAVVKVRAGLGPRVCSCRVDSGCGWGERRRGKDLAVVSGGLERRRVGADR